MGSTYLGRPCKPWLRTHRDTSRVNESPREAREHFASRLKGWVRFFTLLNLFFLGFSKSGFIKETMNNSVMLVYFYFMQTLY